MVKISERLEHTSFMMDVGYEQPQMGAAADLCNASRHQELLMQNEYLAAEDRILKNAHLKAAVA
jgi:hypothetical protein